MHVTNWYKHLTVEMVYRRAGRRRQYNAERQEQAAKRRLAVEARFWDVTKAFLADGKSLRGWQARLAKELNVSRVQIGRDFQTLRASNPALARAAYVLEVTLIISAPWPGRKKVEMRG